MLWLFDLSDNQCRLENISSVITHSEQKHTVYNKFCKAFWSCDFSPLLSYILVIHINSEKHNVSYKKAKFNHIAWYFIPSLFSILAQMTLECRWSPCFIALWGYSHICEPACREAVLYSSIILLCTLDDILQSWFLGGVGVKMQHASICMFRVCFHSSE